jgi:hypothetical protein
MTTTLVVRLTREELANVDSAARHRSLSRSAYVRQLLRTSTDGNNLKKGVGWPERLKELQGKARPVKEHLEDEIREIDRNRWR